MFFAGLDLGQRRDHSAAAVVEAGPGIAGLLVRHVERIPLGTPYPAVVEYARAMVADDEMRGRCSLAVDATGVGAPVVEMLRTARLGCDLTAVTITGGDREHQTGTQWGVQAWSVPKRDLIAGLQVLLEKGELKIARGLRDGVTLVRELMDVRSTAGVSGRTRFGAEGSGQHDDLAVALALACWRAKLRRGEIGFGTRRLPGI